VSSKRAPSNGNSSSILGESNPFFSSPNFSAQPFSNFQLHCIIITTALTSSDEEYCIESENKHRFNPHRDSYQFGRLVNASRREAGAPGSKLSHFTYFFNIPSAQLRHQDN